MTPTSVAAIVFVAAFGGALLGMLIGGMLPAGHLNPEARDVVKLGTGLIATLTALVLGLVTASAKRDFDEQDSVLRHSAAEVLLLDRVLAEYGPEVSGIRVDVKGLVSHRLVLTWPEEENSAARAVLDAPELLPTLEGIGKHLRELTPQNDSQRWLKSRALDISSKLLESRWLVLGSAGNTVPIPFLIVVVFWLAILFANFGLLAPPNATVIVVLLVCALSVAASLFLIIEMDDPFHGLMKVSSTPIRFTIANLGK